MLLSHGTKGNIIGAVCGNSTSLTQNQFLSGSKVHLQLSLGLLRVLEKLVESQFQRFCPVVIESTFGLIRK